MKQLLVICCIFLSLSVTAQSTINDLIKEGVDLHDRGYFEEAIAKYDSALAIEKNHYLATYEKAFTLMHLKRYKEVVALSKTLLKEHKEQKSLSEVYILYGNALDMAGSPKESVAVYNDGIKAFPQVSLLHFNKAITLVGLKEYEKAIDALKQAVVTNPFHASSHFQLANLYQYENKVFSLLAHLTFLALEPDSDRSKASLANIKKAMLTQAKKTGDNSYSVDLDVSQLLNKSKKKEDNFASTDMILTLSSALNADEKNKHESAPERLLRNLRTVVSTFKNRDKEATGFGWDYYVPFFVEMEKAEQLATFSYIVLATEDDAEINKWLSANKEKVDSFYKWMKAFSWAKPNL